ncbi:MAG: hypothetical protein ISR65_11515 [Bacteriovoracaceae bacterium]|nr:hypothetical protein [Bacteriovoracaceae bacterium]
MSIENLEYPGDIEFQEFLTKVGFDMSIFEIRSYLLGLVLGLETVEPSFAVSEMLLLDEDTEEYFQFDDPQDSHQFNHYIQTLITLLEFYRVNVDIPPLSNYADDLNLMKTIEMFNHLSLRQEEFTNFLSGVGESGVFDQKRGDEFEETVDSFEKFLEEVDSLQQEFFDEVDNLESKRDLVLELLQRSDELWVNGYIVIFENLKQLRKSKIALH